MLLAAAAVIASAAEDSAPADGEPVDYMIVVTGAELLTGAYPDSHTHFLTRTLHPLGLHCIGSLTVDDQSEDIAQALRYSHDRAALVIVTGGLGPTANDVTRQSLAAYTGIPLEQHPDVIAAMERRFNTPREQLRANLRRQAQVPVRGTYLKSQAGTAVGLVFETERQVIVALPGPPRELQPMVRDALVPYLSERFGTHLPGCTLTVRFVGLGQSQINQTLDERVPLPPKTTVSSQFEGARVDFGFQLPSDSPAERALLEDLKQRICRELGEFIYADDSTTTLEDHVAQLLDKQHATLALAESGSGGSLAASFSASPAAARVLAGAFVGADNEQLRKLLAVPETAWEAAASAEQQVRLLAEHAAQRTRGSWAIGVGEVESSDGTANVLVALRSPSGESRIQRLAASASDPARGRLVTAIWDLLRRRINAP